MAINIAITTESDLQAFAAVLAPTVTPPMVIGLNGPMGSGKTTCMRYVGEALGISGIHSPTYALIQRYTTPTLTVIHSDLYRLDTDMDISLLDIPSYYGPQTLVCIEWLEKTTQITADITLTFVVSSPDARTITITGDPHRLDSIFTALNNANAYQFGTKKLGG
jgi:tRNA threonylcarbamoyl adenosine modification protein YjeE